MLLALIRIVISKGFISTECRFLIKISAALTSQDQI